MENQQDFMSGLNCAIKTLTEISEQLDILTRIADRALDLARQELLNRIF